MPVQERDMSPKSKLEQIAKDCADSSQRNVLSLESELQQLENRKSKIEAQINAEKLCPKRVSSFQYKVGDDLQCPRCWIAEEKSSPLKPINSPDEIESPDEINSREDIDHFQCPMCRTEISIRI
ncbi:MAG: hypothetical protein HY056_16085 [Proteobacteria bacterium]|nr:hypothetical protein [Pseudomonadota bacterium]